MYTSVSSIHIAVYADTITEALGIYQLVITHKMKHKDSIGSIAFDLLVYFVLVVFLFS